MKRFLPMIVVLFLGAVVYRVSLADGLPWQPASGPYGGSVAALALSPNYAADHTVFAGVRGRGVYRTLDGGFSWQLTSPPDWSVIDVAISPAYATDRTLFAIVGFWTTGYTVHRSTDAGGTWQAATALPPGSYFPFLTRLVVSPNFANDHTLYVLGGSEYRSTDGGTTFVEASGWFASHDVIDLAFSPAYASDRTLFAVVREEGLYKSVDGGVTWNPTNLSGFLSVVAVSPDYTNDHTLAAISLDDGHLHISDDGGVTWSARAFTLAGTDGQHTLLFSPTFASDRIMLVVSAADPGAYRSTDGGVTWSPVGLYDPAQSYLGGFIGGSVHALALAPHTAFDAAAFAGTSSGIYRSSDWGEHWYQRINGLAPLTVSSLAIAPGDPTTLLAGTRFFEQVNSYTPIEIDGNLQLSTDGGHTWHDVSGRLSRVHHVVFSPDFVADRTAFASAGFSGQHGFSEGGLYRSTDGGQNWNKVLNALGGALAVSPDFANDRTVWAEGGSGLLISTDGGDMWSPLTTAVHAEIIVPSPNYAVDLTLFASAFSSGLHKSTDGGSTWTPVLSDTVTALAVSPAYGASQTLYAGVQEASGDPGEVYRSTDGGATWHKLVTGIPATWSGEPLTIAALNFAADGSLVAGVFYGSYGYDSGGSAVYRSVDGGATWQMIDSTLNTSAVFDVVSSANRRDLDPHASLSIFVGGDAGLWRFGMLQDRSSEPGAWDSSGPRGGRAQALAVSPSFASDGVVFSGEWLMGHVGDQVGLGILKSTDSGLTWQTSSAGTESLPYPYGSAVHAYAFSPGFAADRTVFAATWGGLFKSTDCGANWQWLPGAMLGAPGSMSAVALAPDYATSGHVLAGSGWGGIFVSRDGGLSWTPNYSLPAVSAIGYSPKFATDHIAFAASTDGVYRTYNGGTSWTRTMTYPASALVLSPRFGDDHLLYAGGAALYISSNEGTGWITRTVAAGSSHINALAISPAFNADRTLFAGTNAGLYRSTDGGLYWNPIAGFPTLPVLSLAISPAWPGQAVMLAGTAQGVYRTADGGATWTRTQGLATLSTAPISLSSNETLWLSGASNHGVYASSDSGQTWSPIGLQDGSWFYSIGDVAISPAYASDGTLFAARNSDVSIGGSVYRTTDSGVNWQPVYSSDRIGSLAISPQYAADQTVYATSYSNRVLRSSDGGDVWNPVGMWPLGLSGPAQQVALPPNYPSDSTIYAAGSQGFWRLPGGVGNWLPAATGLLSNTYVSDIAVSPNYTASQTLLALASWYTDPVMHYGVFRSVDGGVNWQMASIGLPDEALRGVAFSPNYAADHTAYLISASQLYRSIDGGMSWTAIGSPPGWPTLSDVAMNRAGQVIVTSSAGVWRYRTVLRDVVVDGGFESDSGWELPSTPRPAGYSTRIVYDDRRSLGAGIDNGSNVYAYSSARQTVTVPISATIAQLHFRIYPVTGESTLAGQDALSPAIAAGDTSRPALAAAGDAQYALILAPGTGAISQTLLWSLSNAQTWQHYTFDLTPYAGQTIVLHFGVFNDGAGGRTALYVDDVSLLVSGYLPHRQYLPIVLKGF